MSADPQPAEAHIYNGEIVIRLPIANLQSAALGGWANNNLLALYLDDPARFALAVCHALNSENEIGDTPIHRIFDEAIERAFEDGVGLEISDDAAEELINLQKNGKLGEKMAEIENKAIAKYEEGRKNVSGRPDWFSLDPNDAYDYGMKSAAFEQVFKDLGWYVP